MKLLGKIFAGLVVLVIAIAVLIVISSAVSLDRDFAYTKETSTLPLAGVGTSSLVRIPVGEYEFRARVAGLEQIDAETVILLHGFPVTSAMWIPLMEPLHQAGYRVIAFDQRGYSPGARPADPGAYVITNLVADVISIADAVDAEHFHLIGHDWGSAVGWSTVMRHPDRILSWTGLSIAHPTAFSEALQTDADQQARSQYFTLFTAPYLPETLFTVNDLMVLMGMYGNMLDEQKAEYYAVFSEPGALSSALNWYRMMSTSLAADSGSPEINTPTLFIWGNNDPSAGRAAVEGQEKYMKGSYQEIELDGDHWLVTSHGDQIIPALLSHLQQSPN
jgi:pimeloyl-ACP methyl ester carboxylesterase